MTHSVEEVATAGGALQTLIHQFSDPLSFYRELVQNALDAGSLYVSITITHDDETGEAQVAIEDSGSGMTSHIIDTQLTRLFASNKDGDLTRIGKFGIGFVSVFALQPKRVTLETACDGEAWKVEFFENGEFQRTPLVEPREGTLIRVFKSMTKEEYLTLKKDSRETILYWCKHVRGEILFNGEELNRPFDVGAPLFYRWSEPDTEIVIGYSDDGQPFTGFYNQGLTLMESNTEHIWPGLSVKANSRFLEHTLTRDNIVQDENFEKVKSRIRQMVELEFSGFLLSQLTEKQCQREAVFESLLSHFGWHTIRTMTNNELGHQTGEASGDSWSALPGKHSEGSLVSTFVSLAGLTSLPDQIVVRLSVQPDQHTPDSTPVVNCNLFDLEKMEELTSCPSKWDAFKPEYGIHEFVIPVHVRADQRIHFRVDWSAQVPLTFHDLQLRRLVHRELELKPEHLSLPILRAPSGARVSLTQALEADEAQALWFSPSSSKLALKLEANENVVIVAAPGTAEWRFLEFFFGHKLQRADLEFVSPEEVATHPNSWPHLWPLLTALMSSWNVKLKDFRWAEPGCEQSWFGLLLPNFEGLFPYRDSITTHSRSGESVFVLNSEHELAQQFLALASREPQMAAYLVCKHFLAQTGVSASADAELALAAWRLRCE